AKRNEAARAIKLATEEDAQEGEGMFNGGNQGPRLLYNGVELAGISGIGVDHNGYSEALEDDKPDLLTDREKREQLRRRRQGLVNQYAAMVHGTLNGETIRSVNALLITRYGKSVNQCNT